MRQPRQAGFTLVEVLVALVIVALGMGAVLAALVNAAQTTIRLREKSFAAWVGMNQLTETRLKPGFPVRGKTEGEVEFANTRWHWQQTVEEMQIPGILQITIEVRYADQDGADARPGGPTRTATNDWLATVTGFRGNALSAPQGTLAGWP